MLKKDCGSKIWTATVPRRDVENYMVLVLRRLGPLIYAVEVIYRLSLIPLTVCLLSFVGYSNVM